MQTNAAKAESLGSRELNIEAPGDTQSLGAPAVRNIATLVAVERPKFDPEDDENMRLYGDYGPFPATQLASD